jgi:ubiquinone/menaquinone biosynthesis C-methylase UbiE
MSILNMQERWGTVQSWLYETVVAAGLEPLYKQAVEEASVEIPDGTKVIEVGCGQGQFAARLATCKPACTIIAIDQSAEMIRRAMTCNPRLPNLEFRQADVMSLPFGDGEFSMALALATIKHWPDRLRGVQEILRVLAPGGKLGIVDIDRDCSIERAANFVANWRHTAPGSKPFLARYFKHIVARQSINLDELVGVLTRGGVIGLEARRYTDMPFIFARAGKAEATPASTR